MIDQLQTWLFTCDHCKFHSASLTDKTLVKALKRLGKLGWRIDEKPGGLVITDIDAIVCRVCSTRLSEMGHHD